MLAFLLAFFLPCQFEGSVKATLTRIVALGATWRSFQLVAFAIPYRPNRIYFRLAIARV
jgi:hypothetical protein